MFLDKLNPYALLAKVVGVIVAVALLWALVASWSSRGQTIVGLKNWQTGVTETVTEITQQPVKGKRAKLRPDQVVVALQTLSLAYQRDEALIARISAEAAEAKTRADRADQALANVNLALQTQYATSSKRIAALQNAKATGTQADQCGKALIDSKAAWEAWK